MEFVFSFPERHWVGESDPRDWSVDKLFSNLADFQNWWWRLEKTQYIDLIVGASLHGRLWGPGTNEGDYVLLTPRQAPAQSPRDELVQLDVSWNTVSSKIEYGGEIRITEQYVSFPVSTYAHVPINQEKLGKYFQDWHPGPFKSAFSDLALGARGRERFELEELRKNLAEDAAKGGEVFEAFGMKFPTEQVTLWGILVILSVQLYAFVYLRRLSGKLASTDPGWDVPWIGLDQSRLARLLFFFSLVLLPLITAALLSERSAAQITADYWAPMAHAPYHLHYYLKVGVTEWDRQVIAEVLVLTLSVLCVGALGALCWRVRPRITQKATCSSQLFE